MSDAIAVRPIGIIHSPHVKPEETPVQPVFAEGIPGTVEVFSEFAEGLADLEGYSHIYLVFHFHRAKAMKLKVKPFLQDVERGVFSTRAPVRPNGIGFSVVRLERREGNVLHVLDCDILDGTPLLDIKPYVARFDTRPSTRNGWQDDVSDADAGKRGLRGYASPTG